MNIIEAMARAIMPDDRAEGCKAMLRAALAEAERLGYVLAPKAATMKMIEAGTGWHGLHMAWKNMVAARPSLESEDK